MQVFLVGGAVRDELLGLRVKDRDWVVVGSTPQELMSLGYSPVGKDFPVFLHPQTHEEYALARTERKSAPGYHGFTFHASPEVTLEEDLARRDLTINAMAKTLEGELRDPFGGQKDLQNKIFRHVSPAFQEDPVRVLRLARFAARFPNFTIAQETLQLAQRMAEEGEIQALVAERVWTELSKALMHERPSRLFQVLMDCKAFKILFPDLSTLEDDHTAKYPFFQSLDKAAQTSCSQEIRLALCFYPYASARTQIFLSSAQAQTLLEALKVPTGCKEMALLLLQLSQKAFSLSLGSLKAADVLELMESLDGFRRAERLRDALSAGLIASTFADQTHVHQTIQGLMTALDCTQQLDIKHLTSEAVREGVKGTEIGQLIHQARLDALRTLLGS